MRQLNNSQQALISQLKNGQAKTRKGLCNATGLSWAAVSKTASQLQDLGLISPVPSQSTSGKGRNPSKIQLNDKTYLAGIAINRDRVEAAIYSLNHKLISSKTSLLLPDDDPVPASVTLLRELLLPDIKASLISIGVAFPGIIEANKKYVENSTHFPDFEDRPIGEEIKLSLGVAAPVFVERNAVCDLTHLILHKNLTKDTILLSLKSGVSAAVFIDGKILHGRSGNIGEFGHLNFPEGKMACRCGKIGCIETEIGGIAWKRKLDRETKKEQDPHAFYQGVANADPTALKILEKSFHALFPILGHLNLLLMPEVLALASNLPPSSSLIAATAIGNISRELGLAPQPEICLLEDISTVAGAASIGLLWLSGNKNYR